MHVLGFRFFRGFRAKTVIMFTMGQQRSCMHTNEHGQRAYGMAQLIVYNRNRSRCLLKQSSVAGQLSHCICGFWHMFTCTREGLVRGQAASSSLHQLWHTRSAGRCIRLSCDTTADLPHITTLLVVLLIIIILVLTLTPLLATACPFLAPRPLRGALQGRAKRGLRGWGSMQCIP